MLYLFQFCMELDRICRVAKSATSHIASGEWCFAFGFGGVFGIVSLVDFVFV